ncbi:MAG: glycosyltransferase [Steroidobacteraceae bacterium]
MSSKIKVLHVIADLDPRSGGTSRAVADLTSALSRERGLDVAVMFQSRPGQAHLQTDRSVRRIQVTVGSPWARATGWPMRSALLNEVTRSIPDVIHLHGLWLPSCHWTARLAARRNIPLVIQPHGMLEPWALNHKAVRKRVSMAIYQRRDLNVASLLVASTEREAESLRRLGLERDVVVIPHGIRIDNESNSVGDHAQAKKDLREVLFLSRLHPVKGVSTAVACVV